MGSRKLNTHNKWCFDDRNPYDPSTVADIELTKAENDALDAIFASAESVEDFNSAVA